MIQVKNPIFNYYKQKYNKTNNRDKYYIRVGTQSIFLNMYNKMANDTHYDNKITFEYDLRLQEYTMRIYYLYTFYIENISIINSIMKINEYLFLNKNQINYKIFTNSISKLLPLYIPININFAIDKEKYINDSISDLLKYTDIEDIIKDGNNYIAYYKNDNNEQEYFKFRFQHVGILNFCSNEIYCMVDNFIETLLCTFDEDI